MAIGLRRGLGDTQRAGAQRCICSGRDSVLGCGEVLLLLPNRRAMERLKQRCSGRWGWHGGFHPEPVQSHDDVFLYFRQYATRVPWIVWLQCGSSVKLCNVFYIASSALKLHKDNHLDVFFPRNSQPGETDRYEYTAAEIYSTNKLKFFRQPILSPLFDKRLMTCRSKLLDSFSLSYCLTSTAASPFLVCSPFFYFIIDYMSSLLCSKNDIYRVGITVHLLKHTTSPCLPSTTKTLFLNTHHNSRNRGALQ